jgi:hypothetical protein
VRRSPPSKSAMAPSDVLASSATFAALGTTGVGLTTRSWASLAGEEDTDIDEVELAPISPPPTKRSSLAAQQCEEHEAEKCNGWQDVLSRRSMRRRRSEAMLESAVMMASGSTTSTASGSAVSVKACGADVVRIGPLHGPSPTPTGAGLSTAAAPVAEEGREHVDHGRRAGRDAPPSC